MGHKGKHRLIVVMDLNRKKNQRDSKTVQVLSDNNKKCVIIEFTRDTVIQNDDH